MGIKLLDRNRMRATLVELQEGIPQDAAKICDETADSIRVDARKLVRKDTRSLEKSIRKQTIRREGKTISVRVTAGGYMVNPKTGRLVDYAVHQEYGTSKMEAHPYLRPAVIKNTSKFFWAFIEALKKRVR